LKNIANVSSAGERVELNYDIPRIWIPSRIDGVAISGLCRWAFRLCRKIHVPRKC